MKKKNYLFILLALFSMKVFGQNAVYLGLETGLKFDQFFISDNRQLIDNKSVFEVPLFGVTIEKEFSNCISVETGVRFITYWHSLHFVGYEDATAHNLASTFQIPLSIRTNISLKDDKLFLAPIIGYTFGVNNNYTSYGTGQTTLSNNPRGRKVYEIDAWSSQYKKTFSLLRMGVGLDWKLKNNMKISLSGNYHTGFQKLIDIHYSYRQDDELEVQAAKFSNGNYIDLSFGLKYPISKLWE